MDFAFSPTFSNFAYMKKLALIMLLTALAACVSAQDSLTLMSYNIRNAKGMDKKRDIQRIADIISREKPDAVAIQEVDNMTLRCFKNVMKELGKLTGMHATFAPAINVVIGKYGIGILSREKPISTQIIRLPGSEEKRVLLITEFNDYYFCSTHLSLTPEDRMASLDIINQYAEKSTKPFFLGGDLNARPDSELIDSMSIRFDILNDVNAHTYPSAAPDRTIDYIISWKPYAAQYSIADSRVLYEPIASDHRPIVVKIKKTTPPDDAQP